MASHWKHNMTTIAGMVVQRFIAGSMPAFASIYQQLYRLALAYCLRLYPQLSKEDGQDMVQDAFVRLYQARGLLDPEADLVPYFLRLLRNQALRFCRDRQRQGTYKERLYVHGQALDPLRPLALEQALGCLPEEKREAIVLKYVMGLSLRQVARVQDIPVNTVKTRLFYGLKDMRQCMQGEER